MGTIEDLKDEIATLKKEIKQLKTATKSVKVDATKKSDYQETQIRFRTVFENSRLGNKIISQDLKILQVNHALIKILGYNSKDVLVGTRILEYSPPDHHKDWENLQTELWKNLRASFCLETRLIKKDGTIIWVEVTSILFQDQGETLGYTILEDISKAHELKQQQTEFISAASHELKTPITSLKAGLQLVNRMIKNYDNIPEKIVRLTNDAELNAAKLSTLVEDMLNLTRLDHGELILNKSKFRLSELIDICCDHVRLAGKHHITNKGDLTLEAFADSSKIDQVLVNLVNNAVKYAPGSKDIVIEIKKVKDKVKVSVKDKGKGIPPENIPHLFDRYYQVKKDHRHSSGLGLGLFISAAIIKEHGGEMGVKSKPGEGSIFWFTLPDKE